MKDSAALPLPAGTLRRASPRLIYIACPWSPAGGGMFKVADYLLQSQLEEGDLNDSRQDRGTAHAAEAPAPARLAPLDTRGSGPAVSSLAVLAQALARIAWGRCSGRLAGVHVNMAERLSLVRKGVLVVACRALGVPVVVHLHAAQLHRAWPALAPALRGVVRWVFSLPSCCIALGPASARFVSDALGVPRERVVVITNGVPGPASAHVAAPSQDPAAPLQALFVGNLSDRKGVPQLLQALALAPLRDLPLQLTLAGGGDIDHYQALARQLGVAGRVRFPGWTPQAEVSRLLARSDVFVLPSHDEGLPLALLEALAHGVAVVCTPVGEIPAVIAHGRQALFVAPGQAQALADTLAELVRHPGRRQALAHEGRALYEQRFTMQVFLEAVAEVHLRHFGVAPRWRKQQQS